MFDLGMEASHSSEGFGLPALYNLINQKISIWAAEVLSNARERCVLKTAQMWSIHQQQHWLLVDSINVESLDLETVSVVL